MFFFLFAKKKRKKRKLQERKRFQIEKVSRIRQMFEQHFQFANSMAMSFFANAKKNNGEMKKFFESALGINYDE